MAFTQEKFAANLNEVKRADLAVIELFKRRGHNAYLNPATSYEGMKRGDVIVNGLYVENKVDFESLYTGNVCIEQKSLDRQNDWFGYILPQYYVISRPKLKLLASMSPTVTGGDSNYLLYLPSKADFINEAQLIEPYGR